MHFGGLVRGLVALSLTLSTVTGCAISSPVEVPFCALYEPVYTSEEDTEVTRMQVDVNNATWLEECTDGNS